MKLINLFCHQKQLKLLSFDNINKIKRNDKLYFMMLSITSKIDGNTHLRHTENVNFLLNSFQHTMFFKNTIYQSRGNGNEESLYQMQSQTAKLLLTVMDYVTR